MTYNWQKKEWPDFKFEHEVLTSLEREYFQLVNESGGVLKFINTTEQKEYYIELLCSEAMSTSAIEGEVLSRDSVRSSLRKSFGLTSNQKSIPLREKGISDLLTDLYMNFDLQLNKAKLCKWNRLVLQGRYDVDDLGQYRTHEDPMQIVSGSFNYPVVHFEAPPSVQIEEEMKRFFIWYENSKAELKYQPLLRAGIAHLYFVCIHPFEDGNGRIARALSQKILFENAQRPIHLSLSTQIQKNRNEYYDQLEENNKDLDVTGWLVYFAQVVVEAVRYSQKMVDFLMHKTLFFDRHRDSINRRQQKVINRIFTEGIEGFKGGLSAKNYVAITKASRATATRDLQDLVDKNIFNKIGDLKSTRYFLNLKMA